MICRIVPAVLLSLSLLLSGCAVYELDGPGYSTSRYSGYGYQQLGYSVAHSDAARSGNYVYQQPRYSDVRSNSVYQQPRYPVVRYREYPQVQLYRYPSRQPVYIYRQAPGYWPMPMWRDRGEGYRDEGYRQRDHDRRAYQRDQRERYERREHYGDERRGRDEHRGWELRLN